MEQINQQHESENPQESSSPDGPCPEGIASSLERINDASYVPEPDKVEPLERSQIRGSTGPRSESGKRRSSQNAIKYGICSKDLLLKGESRLEYESLVARLRGDFTPQGELEIESVETIAVLIWRKRRLIRAEKSVIEERVPMLMLDTPQTSMEVLALCEPRYKKASALIPSQNVSELLMRYEVHLSREMDRTLARLERLQNLRQGKPGPPRIDVTLNA